MSVHLESKGCWDDSCYYSLGVSAKPKPAQIESGGALYPNLLSDYSVISMVSSEDDKLQKLLPKAKELSTSLSSNTSYLERLVHRSNNGEFT